MPTFQFEAMDNAGQEIKDEIDAPNQEEAISQIRALGYFPTQVRQKGGKRAVSGPRGKRHKRGTFTIGRVSGKQLCAFTRQLSTLQDAGLPILRSLKILEGQMKPGVLKNALMDVVEDIEGGSTLSEAFARHPKAFDRLYVNMVKAGEAGGVLETILRRLAEFKEKGQSLRRKVTGAMIYPVVVVLVACCILTFILVFIIPKFEKIFGDFGVELPGMTQFLIGASHTIMNYWFLFPAIPIGIYVAAKLIKKNKTGAYIMDKVKLNIPVFGNLIEKSIVARTTRTLGTLIAAGVPILEGLNIVRDTAGNEVFARAFSKVYDSIREGETIAQPLKQARVCDDMVINMIDVGEETGDLDKMLMKVADTYDEEVDTLVEGLVSLLEPIMIVTLGGMIGFIVIALFMPLIHLLNNLGQGGN